MLLLPPGRLLPMHCRLMAPAQSGPCSLLRQRVLKLQPRQQHATAPAAGRRATWQLLYSERRATRCRLHCEAVCISSFRPISSISILPPSHLLPARWLSSTARCWRFNSSPRGPGRIDALGSGASSSRDMAAVDELIQALDEGEDSDDESDEEEEDEDEDDVVLLDEANRSRALGGCVP